MAHAAAALSGTTTVQVQSGKRPPETSPRNSKLSSHLPELDAAHLVELARKADNGFSKAEVAKLVGTIAAVSSVPSGKLRAQIIADSTWKRAGKRLGPQASQTAARLSRVFAFAEKVWGNEKDAADWMNRPHMELGGATPYSMLRTEAGGHAVLNVLVALEYGFPV